MLCFLVHLLAFLDVFHRVTDKFGVSKDEINEKHFKDALSEHKLSDYLSKTTGAYPLKYQISYNISSQKLFT